MVHEFEELAGKKKQTETQTFLATGEVGMGGASEPGLEVGVGVWQLVLDQQPWAFSIDLKGEKN